MPKDIKTFVMYAPLCNVDTSVPLYPSERYSEIQRCKSEKVRHEKYLVWKLLERAVEMNYNLKFANLQFTKTTNGKWVCPDLYFSLSHTDGAVCVALSDKAVGVDIEKVKDVKLSFKDKILTEREKEKMDTLPESERGLFLLRAWVKKESIFKMGGGEALLPARIETIDSIAKTQTLSILDKEYVLSVASFNDNIEIVYTEEL